MLLDIKYYIIISQYHLLLFYLLSLQNINILIYISCTNLKFLKSLIDTLIINHYKWRMCLRWYLLRSTLREEEPKIKLKTRNYLYFPNLIS